VYFGAHVIILDFYKENLLQAIPGGTVSYGGT
jgi:hypothetical protein